MKEDSMPQSFNCPNCSAPLDVQINNITTVRCPYCNSSVIVPEELRGKSPGLATSPASHAAIPSSSQIDIDDRLKFIREMAMAGNKIVAIKAIRETFVISLKQAVAMVDAMQRGEMVDVSQLKLLTPTSLHSTKLDPDTVQRLMSLIQSGDKIAAIKLFREATGVGLKEAKNTIEGMASSFFTNPVETVSEIRIPYGSKAQNTFPATSVAKRGIGCLLPGFILFILLVTVIPILAGLTSRGGPLAGVWARVNPFAAGRVDLAFGKEGTGPGYFTDARFVSVDNNGHIFVGEFTGARIQVFDEDGKYLTQWRAIGEETGDIYLAGMAAYRNGAVYIVVGSMLYVYDGMSGYLLGRLDHPEGWGFDDVTVAPDGSVLAAWYKSHDDLVRFDRNGQINLLVENAIGTVTNDSEMETQVAVDGIGNIYALACFNEGVFIFSPEGRYISRFGSEGEAKGQFTSHPDQLQ
jgi:ribosomal protein L7/L12/DNA-directed RNA polymerase subunit RPC12/RpoP